MQDTEEIVHTTSITRPEVPQDVTTTMPTIDFRYRLLLVSSMILRLSTRLLQLNWFDCL